MEGLKVQRSQEIGDWSLRTREKGLMRWADPLKTATWRRGGGPGVVVGSEWCSSHKQGL